jgi:hypothetical protein
MGLWVLILVAVVHPSDLMYLEHARSVAITQEFVSEAACQNAENFIKQDLEKRKMVDPTKVAGGCVRKY